MPSQPNTHRIGILHTLAEMRLCTIATQSFRVGSRGPLLRTAGIDMERAGGGHSAL